MCACVFCLLVLALVSQVLSCFCLSSNLLNSVTLVLLIIFILLLLLISKATHVYVVLIW